MSEERESTETEVAEATKQGWRDDPDHPKYKPAWQFVEDGEKIAPIQAERYKKVEKELKATRESVEQMRSDFFAERRAAQEEGYKKAMAEIKAQQRAAVEEGDTETFDKLEARKDKIKPPEPMPAQQKQEPEAESDPIFVDWRDKNAQWYGTDKVLTGLADGVGAEIMTSNPMYGKDFYTEVDRRVRELMPERFASGDTPQAVEGGDRRPKRKGKKDFRALPKDVQETFESNRRLQNLFGSDQKGKELYAKEYFAEYPEG